MHSGADGDGVMALWNLGTALCSCRPLQETHSQREQLALHALVGGRAARNDGPVVLERGV